MFNGTSCNLSESQDQPTFLIVGVINLFGILFCGLILAFLLLILKKKAWESQVKRLGLSYTISIALSSLTFASIYLSSSPPTCVVGVLLHSYWNTSILLYFNTLLVSLLLQVIAPLIPERWKHTRRYIPKAKYTEVILHISIFVLTLTISMINVSSIQKCCRGCCVTAVLFDVIVFVLLALSAFILVFTILIFGFFFLKFHKTRMVTKTTKWAVTRLSVVFMTIIVYTLYLIVPSRIEQKLIYHNIIFVDIIFDPTVLELVLLLPLIMVIYLPNTQFCKCHKKPSDQLPLLPYTDTQPTNPPSEWDHSNVPSNTVSVHPKEMSDCETDHISSLIISGPKYGSTTSRI